MPNFSNDQWQEAMVSIANTGISTTPPTDVVSTTGSPITADQGVVTANFGAGVASWSVEATGTFSAGTTLFFEFQLTGSGGWYQAFGVPIGSTSDVAASSVVGGAPITYQGNAAGFQAFRVRAHPLAGGDSVTVKIVGSLATDGGFVSKSLPPGTNSIGSVTANGGTNLNTSTLALESGGNLAASKADLDTIVTNTNKIPASPATEGGNLATIAGAISSNKMATKAASGDFVDGALATIGAQADASATTDSGTFSYMSLFKRLLAKFPVIGTQTSANSSSVVIASDQANVPVKGGFTEQASLTAGSLNADLVASTDVSAYKWWSLQILTIATGGTLSFQGSNDGTTFVSIPANSTASTSGLFFSSTTTGIYHGPVIYRYLRIRQTAYSSGSSTGVLELYTSPASLDVVNSNALQSGTWTVQPGNTQNTTPWLMAGPNANGTQAANSAANTVIKGSAGWFYHAIITTLGTAGLTIYDNATTNSGTPLLVIPASAAVGTIYSFPSGARAVNGITSAGVTNCPAVTFHYT